jgi:alkanesulfonate monooxygenase SsuD/methylene tetrahydromethanopterin reductase-like flavin-dependent oxidoreductase (luciferase family)
VRTDEVLEASMQLLQGRDVTYEGRYYNMHDITVEPLSHVPPVWAAGGQQLAHEASPDLAAMAPKVLDRICKWDGWIARPTAEPRQIVEDLRQIDDELIRRGRPRTETGFTIAHENFCWLTEETDPDTVLDDQKKHLLGVVSDERPWDYIETVYMTGTIDRIQQRIQARIDAGVEHIFLHTMTADLGQLDLFAKHILEPFKSVEPPPAPPAS